MKKLSILVGQEEHGVLEFDFGLFGMIIYDSVFIYCLCISHGLFCKEKALHHSESTCSLVYWIEEYELKSS